MYASSCEQFTSKSMKNRFNAIYPFYSIEFDSSSNPKPINVFIRCFFHLHLFTGYGFVVTAACRSPPADIQMLHVQLVIYFGFPYNCTNLFHNRWKCVSHNVTACKYHHITIETQRFFLLYWQTSSCMQWFAVIRSMPYNSHSGSYTRSSYALIFSLARAKCKIKNSILLFLLIQHKYATHTQHTHNSFTSNLFHILFFLLFLHFVLHGKNGKQNVEQRNDGISEGGAVDSTIPLFSLSIV